ncbi:hypothetical protein ElyMa_001540900 [Elysia marginata]|uniref:Uncharacterized protein n=1 Tax=Elysia marginata TaxID=1093978 RepID=A0AAV4JAB0_9GAST|nr:hypothetical protein ElyMa_001540900 [Elysia marginata]
MTTKNIEWSGCGLSGTLSSVLLQSLQRDLDISRKVKKVQYQDASSPEVLPMLTVDCKVAGTTWVSDQKNQTRPGRLTTVARPS